MLENSPQTPACWQLRHATLRVARLPLLMGIVNVTPDSFSDGGLHVDPQRAVDHALELVDQGAGILDIGGESTRPYSCGVSAEEELARVIPVVRELCRRTSTPVSIDTSKAVVARAALEHGAQIINDVTGLQHDPEMIRLAVQSGAGVCAMHMQGNPATMQDRPEYEDVLKEISDYLATRRDRLLEAGIPLQRICLDPGIGFGKTLAHNLTLLARCGELRELGCPILVGHSRKGLIGQVLGDQKLDRTPGTIGVALSLAAQGVHILRVHDVGPVRQALQLFDATGGLG